MVLRHRKSNRLKNFDYSSGGYYFITICINKRKNIFGEINDQKMILNKYGQIINLQWLWLEKQYHNSIEIDEYIIMPNHFHGILIIKYKSNYVGTGLDLSLQKKRLSLSNFICAFKTTSSKQIHRSGLQSFQWQRSFYDEIIRNEYSLFKIRLYIKNNPENWGNDRNNLSSDFPL